MSTIILQRFANREYRLTHQSIYDRKKTGKDKYAEKMNERYARAVHDTYVLSQELQQGEAASISDGKLRRHLFGEVDARLGLRALDIINEFQPIAGNRTKGGQGALSRPTSFTRNARHRLLEAGAIVDKDCGRDAWEITLTVPGSGREVMEAVAAHSGWLINRLLRDVRKEKCLYWFYVWEWQSRGMLHLHLLVAGLGRSTKSVAHSVEYNWWELLLELSEKLGIDLFRKNKRTTWKYRSHKWQSHTAPIQKSVAAYFSKYAGKGSSSKPAGFSPKAPPCPSRWWGSSSHLKKRIQESRAKYSVTVRNSTAREIKEYLERWLEDRGRIKRYHYEFDLGTSLNGTPLGGGEVQINYYTDEAFARMQTWESTLWSGALEIAQESGDYDPPREGWTNADMECKHALDADMEKRRHHLSNADMQTRRPPSPPHSQPSPLASKLRNARGTQPEATLALRALAVQFLAGGGEGANTREVDSDADMEPIQLDLFDKNYYERLTLGMV